MICHLCGDSGPVNVRSGRRVAQQTCPECVAAFRTVRIVVNVEKKRREREMIALNRHLRGDPPLCAGDTSGQQPDPNDTGARR